MPAANFEFADRETRSAAAHCSCEAFGHPDEAVHDRKCPVFKEPPEDDHAYIHDMMGDASVLSDRMDYDPTALAGIVGRLVNSISILSDQNKALTARVAELEKWQRAEETAALEASERE